MRVAPFAFVAFMIAAPILGLPHRVWMDAEAPRTLAIGSPATSRGFAYFADELVERASKPSLKIETKKLTRCNSGEYTAIDGISWLDCSRRQGYAFLFGGYCWLPTERDFAKGGPVEKGTCYVFRAK